MDMSVKLSLSYPAVATQGSPVGKTQDAAPVTVEEGQRTSAAGA